MGVDKEMIWPFKRKEAGQHEVKPPVDLNTPVTNPILKEALSAYKSQQSPDNEARLLHGLMTANYLVPILTDEMKTTPGDKPGQTTIQAGSLIKFMCCYNAQNDSLLPAFTDWDEIRAWTKENVSTLVIHLSGFGISSFATNDTRALSSTLPETHGR